MSLNMVAGGALRLVPIFYAARVALNHTKVGSAGFGTPRLAPARSNAHARD